MLRILISNQKAARLALLLNLLGTILIYVSFQATASDFRFVTTDEKIFGGPWAGQVVYALCVNDYTVVETNGITGIGIGHNGCPDYGNSKPAAVVVTEFPKLAGFGFLLSMMGFAIQFFTVPTVARQSTTGNGPGQGSAPRGFRHEWDDSVLRMVAVCTLIIVACFIAFLPKL